MNEDTSEGKDEEAKGNNKLGKEMYCANNCQNAKKNMKKTSS